VTQFDPVCFVLEVAAAEAALCCALVASVIAWDWHFGLPFALTQPWSAGGFHVATPFGRGPMVGTAVAWAVAAALLCCIADGQSHVRLFLATFAAHLAVTAAFGFPLSAEWWFANTLG
jgi:hypothetical protein